MLIYWLLPCYVWLMNVLWSCYLRAKVFPKSLYRYIKEYMDRWLLQAVCSQWDVRTDDNKWLTSMQNKMQSRGINMHQFLRLKFAKSVNVLVLQYQYQTFPGYPVLWPIFQLHSNLHVVNNNEASWRHWCVLQGQTTLWLHKETLPRAATGGRSLYW